MRRLVYFLLSHDLSLGCVPHPATGLVGCHCRRCGRRWTYRP